MVAPIAARGSWLHTNALRLTIEGGRKNWRQRHESCHCVPPGVSSEAESESTSGQCPLFSAALPVPAANCYRITGHKEAEEATDERRLTTNGGGRAQRQAGDSAGAVGQRVSRRLLVISPRQATRLTRSDPSGDTAVQGARWRRLRVCASARRHVCVCVTPAVTPAGSGTR